jgi:hypothetical protein
VVAIVSAEMMSTLPSEAAKEVMQKIVGSIKPLASETVSMQPEITLSESKLRELWNKGVLPDLAYIAFALEIERGNDIDAEVFARNWSVSAEELSEIDYENGWKPKRLKKRSVVNAILILEEKLLLTNQMDIQVQLNLFDLP